MSVRRLDKNRDWTFGQGKNNYANNSEAVAQTVQAVLLSFKGDWFLNAEHGIAWFDLMGRNVDLNQIKSELTSTVLNVVGVKKITDYKADLNRETRNLTVTITYKDIFGKESKAVKEFE